jgi:hypothetical protein
MFGGIAWLVLVACQAKAPASPDGGSLDAARSDSAVATKSSTSTAPNGSASAKASAVQTSMQASDRDVWGEAEVSSEPIDLARLGSNVGPDELLEVAEAEATAMPRRLIALQALGHACTAPRGHHVGGSCPFRALLPLARIVETTPDAAEEALQAGLALVSSSEVSQDPEDFEEVMQACEKYQALMRNSAQPKKRRVWIATLLIRLWSRKLSRPWLHEKDNPCRLDEVPADLASK